MRVRDCLQEKNNADIQTITTTLRAGLVVKVKADFKF